MKVISLLQPWATLVVIGAKKIETRSWNTKHRGPILIHASSRKVTLNEGSTEFWNMVFGLFPAKEYAKLPYGAIIGQANIVDTFSTNDLASTSNKEIKRQNRFWKIEVEKSIDQYCIELQHLSTKIKRKVDKKVG